MKILAVDDDECILELLPMIAAKAGFSDVSTAISGFVALDALRNSETVFDCLLLDINMPGMDGVELCRQVRAIPAYRKTPIIMLTAMTNKEYIDVAFKAGATDYATKPFDIVELGARLRNAQELVLARQDMALSASRKDLFSSEVNHRHTFDLADAISINSVTSLTDYKALENYLAQLWRAGSAASQVIAIKIDQIDAIYARASSEEFTYALSEVAAAIKAILEISGYLMAYAGNGIFLVISNADTLASSIELENEIQSLIDEKNTEYDDGNPLDIEVSIGSPIGPNSNEPQVVWESFNRAIARANSRASVKKSELRPINIRPVGI